MLAEFPITDFIRMPKGSVAFLETEDAVALSRRLHAAAHSCKAKVSTKVYVGVEPDSMKAVKLLRCEVETQGQVRQPRRRKGRSENEKMS